MVNRDSSSPEGTPPSADAGRARGMNLRRHLLALLAVSSVAVLVSGLAVWQTAQDGARYADATDLAQRALRAVQEADAATIDAGVRAGALHEIARQEGVGAVGLCDHDGALRDLYIGHGPPFAPGGTDLPPLDRDFIAEACREANDAVQVRLRAVPEEDLCIAAVEAKGAVAFALVRVSKPRATTISRGPLLPVSLALATVFLLGLTARVLFALRHSTLTLSDAMRAMEADLRAPVGLPQAHEFRALADRLQVLAAKLSDAQERERELTERVAEQRQLAALGRVVAGVAHEVRNPLSGIKLRLESMAERPLDARSKTDVERSLREVLRLEKLVANLLRAARSGAPVETTLFDLGELVDERLHLAAELAEPREVSLARTGTGTACGDRGELAGALDNLLRNAVEASPAKGAVEVVITAGSRETTITVRDRGPGVPPGRTLELFEPFFTTKATGTGLGLVLCRAVVEAHGGTLRYERRGDCTEFTMRLAPNQETQ